MRTAGKKAKDTPVTRKQGIDAAEQQVGQDHPRVMNTEGPASESLEPARIEPVEGPNIGEKARILAFMEEYLTVVVHESADQNDDPIPEVWNGGIVQRFIRGQEMQVRRKFVEVLARAKRTVFSQRKVLDGNGNETFIQEPRTSLRYPFAVNYDPSGDIGRAWLKKILAEG